MSEWWTYALSDFLLFSPRTYYRLFELYNAEIWPTQALALALGATILLLLARGGARATSLIFTTLALCWLFIAGAFHLNRYATINWAATYVAAAFAVQAILLLAAAWWWRLTVTVDRLALTVFLFALVAQPLSGLLLGRPWTQVELFGVAPDPTAVATLGLLAMTAGSPAWALRLIPLIWCAITGVTLMTMDAPDAMVAPLAALISLIATWRRPRAPSPRTPAD
jgi:hypothetical protein